MTRMRTSGGRLPKLATRAPAVDGKMEISLADRAGAISY